VSGDHSLKRSLLQGVAEAGIELCWLYAAALFFFRVGDLSPFPALGALLPFLAAVVPRAIARGRGWRIYQVAFLYLAALVLAVLASIYAFGRWNGNLPITDPHWIGRVIRAASGDTLIILTLLLFCLAFWWSGLAFARRSPSGDAVTRRFDLGAAVFAAVVLLGVAVHRTSRELHLLIPSFFLFSILALAVARSRGSGRRSFGTGSRGAGIFVSFALAGIVLGLAILPLLRVLQDAAQKGYVAVHGAAMSIWPFVVALLRFLFGLLIPRSSAPENALPNQQAPRLTEELSHHGPGLFGLIFTWTMIGLSGVAAVVFLGYLLLRLLRFLGSRSPGGREKRDGLRLGLLIYAIISAARALLRMLLRVVHREPPRRGKGMEAFLFLTRWGRRSGARRLERETPLQYGRRLAQRFPELALPIAGIVESFDEEFYGASLLPSDRDAELERCRRQLTRLSLWLKRTRWRVSPRWEES